MERTETTKHPKVTAGFHSSSQKGGGEAYDLVVTDEASKDDVIRTVANAAMARDLMRAALARTLDEIPMGGLDEALERVQG